MILKVTVGEDMDSFNKALSPDLEMIKHQLNDETINDGERILQDLVDYVNVHKDERNSHISKSDLFKSKILEMNKLMTDRFGINFIFTYSPNMLLGVYVIPSGTNVIHEDHEELMKDFEKMKEATPDDVGKDTGYVKKHKELDKMLKVSYESLKDLKLSGMKIDLKNAKISGLPKDYKTAVISDIPMLVKEFNLTGRELMAGILHEIGHIFTAFEQSYRTTINTTIILDTIRDETLKKNVSTRDTLEIIYSKVNGVKVEEVKDKSTYKIIRGTLEGLVQGSTHNRASADSEQLADNFAVMFGYGQYLTEFLNKIAKFDISEKSFGTNILLFSISTHMFVVAIYLRIIAYLFMMTLVGIPIGFLLIMLSNFVIKYIVKYSLIKFKTPFTGIIVYDSDYNRVRRIRNATISILKDSELPNKDIKVIIEQADSVIKMLYSISNKHSLYKKLMLKLSKRYQTTDKEIILEDMLNSELTLLSKKFKLKGIEDV